MPAIRSSGPYIPRADGRFRDWLNNFAAVIAREPWAVGLMPDDAAMLIALAQRYESAYVRATSPGTRSRPAVAEKNGVRKQAWRTVRPVAMRIKRHRGIGDSLKIELGIYPPHNAQSRVKRPRTAPRLTIDRMSRGVHRLRHHDPGNPSRYAKPRDVMQVQLMIEIGDGPSSRPRHASRIHIATRHVLDVPFDARDIGKTATYFARWVTERGLAGPWSPPLAMTIV